MVVWKSISKRRKLDAKTQLSSGAVLALLVSSSCSSELPVMDNLLTILPENFSCAQLEKVSKESATRADKLHALMEKSANPIVNAVAYETDYAKAVAAQHAAERAFVLKQCEPAGDSPKKEPSSNTDWRKMGPLLR